MAVTGPNGTGKSTLLRLIAGLLPADAGTLQVRAAGQAEGHSHYLGHSEGLKPALTLRETLTFWAALHGGNRRDYPGKPLARAADAVGLGHALDLPVAVLSAGQRRRATLVRLLVTPRPLWLLDEPTSALDAAGVSTLGGLMTAHLGRGGVIIAASHDALPVRHDLDLALGAA